MAIPKKYKKELKGAIKSARNSGAEIAKAKKKWTVCTVGDLVETKEGISTVIADRGDGWYQLLGPTGRHWIRGTKIKRLQKAKG